MTVSYCFIHCYGDWLVTMVTSVLYTNLYEFIPMEAEARGVDIFLIVWYISCPQQSCIWVTVFSWEYVTIICEFFHYQNRLFFWIYFSPWNFYRTGVLWGLHTDNLMDSADSTTFTRACWWHFRCSLACIAQVENAGKRSSLWLNV